MSSARHKIVIVYPYKFTDNYHRKYEVQFLKRYCDVIVWDIGYFLHPRFTQAISATNSDDACVKRVDCWTDFFRELSQLRFPRGTKILFLQFSQPINFRAFICNLIIKWRGDSIVDFYNTGAPFEDLWQTDVLAAKWRLRIFARFFRVLQLVSARDYLRAFLAIRSRCILILSELFSLQPTHRVIAGKAMDERYRAEAECRGIKVISGLTWDLSNSLAYESEAHQPVIFGRYAVLLDGAGPAYVSDQELIGSKSILTSDKWYPTLVSFFEQLEHEMAIKIVVAGHPKSKFVKNPKEFGFREVIYGCTENLVKHSEFVIMRFSTAVSYAVMYAKPILIIYNEQIKSHSEYFNQLHNYADILSISPINIDALPPSIVGDLRVTKDAYTRYKENYLTSLNDHPKPNYRIIIEDILGLDDASCA